MSLGEEGGGGGHKTTKSGQLDAGILEAREGLVRSPKRKPHGRILILLVVG